MKKLLIGIALVLGISLALGFTRHMFFPSAYKHGYWMEPFDRHLRKFDFANYNLPENYEMATYRSGKFDEKKLVLFKEKNSGQLLALTMLREYLNADLNQIRFEPEEPKQPLWGAERHPVAGNFFALWYYLPFLWRDDIKNAGNDVTIKGIKVDPDSRENFSTEKTNVLYARGEFDKLGFYKKSTNWRPYVTPVLDFMGSRKGAIAIIKDKKTGKTIFAVGCNYLNQPFNEEEFKNIVKSLDLDATPLPEAFSGIKGMRKKTTITRT